MHLKIRNISSQDIHTVKIVSDGSASPEYRIGAWASRIITSSNENKVLKGTQENTTQHAMELKAIINSLKYIQAAFKNVFEVEIYTDSDYVLNLLKRRDKLIASNFRTKNGKEIRNRELIMQLYEYLTGFPVRMMKVKGHTKKGTSVITDHHREVDKLSRKLVRQRIQDL